MEMRGYWIRVGLCEEGSRDWGDAKADQGTRVTTGSWDRGRQQVFPQNLQKEPTQPCRHLNFRLLAL